MVKNDQGVWSNITRGTVENDHIEKSREKSSNIIYTCFTTRLILLLLIYFGKGFLFTFLLVAGIKEQHG